MRVICEGLCYIIYPNPLEKKKNQQTNGIEVDWWAASIKVLSNPRILAEFNRKSITTEQVVRVEKLFAENAAFLNLKIIQNQ